MVFGGRENPRLIGVRGKSGFCFLVFIYKSLKRGKEIDRGKSRFALYRGAVNRGFTVLYSEMYII